MKQFGSFQFDTQNECLWHGGRQISVKPKPFSVLRYLVEHPQRLVTHDELLEALWPETYVQPQVLRTYVLELRKLLGDDAENPQFIATLPKRGYRFLAAVEDVAISANSVAAAPTRIMGRDRELQILTSLLKKAGAGERQVFFLTGEAGMGKSALLDAFFQAHPSTVMARGQCVEGFGGKEPWHAITELLADLCGSRSAGKALERRRQAFAVAAPGWFSQLTAPPHAEVMRPARDRMLGELCAGLEAVAEPEPMLLLIEDLQWADPETLDCLSALARRRGPANLMLVATYRAAEAAAGHAALRQLAQDLNTRRLVTTLELSPLNEDSVAAYLAAKLAEHAPGAPPQGLAGFVHQQSEGNPLFMIATVDHLLSQKLVAYNQAAQAWRITAPLPDVDVGVPSDLSGMIETQVEQRSDRQQRLLEAGAIVGLVFPVWAAAAILEVDPLTAEAEYEALARQVHFLHAAGHDELPDGTRSSFYVLAHRVYREVLYRRQPVARRSRAHLRVAEQLLTLFHGREANIALELAAHFESAGDWPRAADALCAAAEAAIPRRAGAEAAGLLTHALELLQNADPEQRQHREARIHQKIAGLIAALYPTGH